MSDEKKREVGYLFALAYNMGEGASLTLSGNFAIGAAKEFMDAELDKCHAVMDRQRAKVMIPAIEDKLRIEEKQIENMQAQLNEMSASVRDAYEKDRQPNGATDAQTIRMRLYKLRVRELDLGFSASLSATPVTPMRWSCSTPNGTRA